MCNANEAGGDHAGSAFSSLRTSYALHESATVEKAAPLGATVTHEGVNFCIFTRNATAVDLLLFDQEDDAKPARSITINPTTNRTYHYWHVFVPGLGARQIYAYRIRGPLDPANGLYFDPNKILLDPYGRGVVVPKNYDRNAVREQGDNTATAMKSVVVDSSVYDWEGDTPLKRPSTQTIVYEMHVRGFTRHPSSGVPPEIRGTYRGLIDKIPYLRNLGITASGATSSFSVRHSELPAAVWSITGDINQSPSSRRIAPTVRDRMLTARWTSSATWLRHCTAQVSR